MSYVAPVKDMKFVIKELAGLNAINQIVSGQVPLASQRHHQFQLDLADPGRVADPILHRRVDEAAQLEQPDQLVEGRLAFGRRQWQSFPHALRLSAPPVWRKRQSAAP